MQYRSKCLPFLTYGIFSIFSHFQPKRKGREKEKKKRGLGWGLEGLRKKENQCALYLLVNANFSGCHLLVCCEKLTGLFMLCLEEVIDT